ncbi:MAG TPA: RNA polymerase sigma factor [Bryobacteraceae bacterium]|jgi:RNA polymerase sigma-70 factor (ECF subfamily)
MSEEEERLLEELRNAAEGDLRAFEGLVRLHQRRIVADCRHITKDQSIAEDLAQEVFVKAYFGLANFEGRASFRHWLQVIKVHHCLNHLKKQKNKAISMEDEGLRGAELKAFSTIDKDFGRISDREIIHRVLDAMPEALRIPLVLRDMDELSYEEVAGSLKIGLSAAKMRIKRAREWFKNRYQIELGMTSQRAYE